MNQIRMTDKLKLNFKSEIGIQIQSTYRAGYVEMDFSFLATTQAEKRRCKLRWNLNKNIALKNKFLFWIALIPLCITEAVLLLLLYGVLDNYVHGAIVGVFGAILIIEAWIITYVILNEKFETDPDYINLRR